MIALLKFGDAFTLLGTPQVPVVYRFNQNVALRGGWRVDRGAIRASMAPSPSPTTT